MDGIASYTCNCAQQFWGARCNYRSKPAISATLKVALQGNLYANQFAGLNAYNPTNGHIYIAVGQTANSVTISPLAAFTKTNGGTPRTLIFELDPLTNQAVQGTLSVNPFSSQLGDLPISIAVDSAGRVVASGLSCAKNSPGMSFNGMPVMLMGSQASSDDVGSWMVAFAPSLTATPRFAYYVPLAYQNGGEYSLVTSAQVLIHTAETKVYWYEHDVRCDVMR